MLPDPLLGDETLNAANPEWETLAFHVDVEIQGHCVRALIDSGASRTFAGVAGLKLFSQVGIASKVVAPRRIILAAGQVEVVNHASTFLATLNGRSTETTAYLMPQLSEDFVLGMDFLRAARMVIDFYGETWFYRDDPETRFPFIPLRHRLRSIICCGLRELTPDDNKRLTELISTEVPPVTDKPGLTTLTAHHIDVGSNEPIRQKPYPVTPIIRDIMWKEVDTMLKDGIIQPSQSNWSSPVVMVKKPGGKYRFCIDFRKVNAVTKKDAYPIPNMTGILDELRQACYITTLDLSQAYFQIPLTPESREVTAFVVPGRGLFHFLRMPYGLTNAPATFQRLLDRLVGTAMYPHAFVYLDDIIVVTRTFDEHLHWLRQVLQRIRYAGLTINRAKCEFCRSEVRYLGFVVNQKGLLVDPDKIAPVVDYPVPKNLKQLRRFLGMASWYRRFIPEFALIAEPLHRLTKKSQAWEWGEEQQKAFDRIRDALTTTPTLTRPNFELPFTVQTDASSVGLGAVLTQEVDGHERVVAYASRALTDPEKKYTVTEQECLAVIWAIRKFRCYLEGYSFTVITDHSSLRWLHNLKNPTGRLARWALELLEYDFTIIHRKGALHHVPDALSRTPENDIADGEAAKRMQPTDDRWYIQRYRAVQRVPDRFPEWKVVHNRLYCHRRSDFVSLEMEDYDAWKLVLPRELRAQAITESHDLPQAGHLGVDKTYRRLTTQYYWPNMLRDVIAFVKHCDTCQRCKVEQNKPAGLMGRRIVEEPWTSIAADIMGPVTRSKSGFCYILVIQDLFTKWIEVLPLRRATGKLISKALEDFVICRWGTPRTVLTDNGTEFVNRDIRELVQRTGLRHITTPPYHPQANPVERVNRVLKTMLRAYIDSDQREWDVHLHEFRYAYNSAFHSSLQSTPAFANFGREPAPAVSMRRELEGDLEIVPRDPIEWIERMKRLETLRTVLTHALDEAHHQQAHYYNLRHRDREFEIGELVLKRSHPLSNAARKFSAALAKPFVGPYVISKKLSRVRYELTDLAGRPQGVISIQDLKPYHTPALVGDP